MCGALLIGVGCSATVVLGLYYAFGIDAVLFDLLRSIGLSALNVVLAVSYLLLSCVRRSSPVRFMLLWAKLVVCLASIGLLAYPMNRVYFRYTMSLPAWNELGTDEAMFAAMGLIGVVWSAVPFFKRRKPPEGMCTVCGYCVTGLNCSTCPECGTKTVRTE